jgi:small-conductance mechanosensitive channel
MLAQITETTDTINKTFVTSKDALVDSFNNAFRQIIDWTPRVVALVALLVFGYLAARLANRVVSILCEKFGLQAGAERSGLAESMQHMGITRSMPAIMGTIVFWLILCIFVMAGFNVLGLKQLSEGMEKVVAYIPHLAVATVLIVVGLFIASFVRGVVATSADRVGISYSEHLATFCYYFLVGTTFFFAFDQLKLEIPSLVQNLVLIGFGALAAGVGLAIGLGGRDVMSGILAGYYVRQRLQAGDKVTMGNISGTVREVGAVATIIETREDGLVNRHSVPNVKVLNEAVR